MKNLYADFTDADLMTAIAGGDRKAAVEVARRDAAAEGKVLRIGKPSESNRPDPSEVAKEVLGDAYAALVAVIEEAVSLLTPHGVNGDPDALGQRLYVRARRDLATGKAVIEDLKVVPTHNMSPKWQAANAKSKAE